MSVFTRWAPSALALHPGWVGMEVAAAIRGRCDRAGVADGGKPPATALRCVQTPSSHSQQPRQEAGTPHLPSQAAHLPWRLRLCVRREEEDWKAMSGGWQQTRAGGSRAAAAGGGGLAEAPAMRGCGQARPHGTPQGRRAPQTVQGWPAARNSSAVRRRGRGASALPAAHQ